MISCNSSRDPFPKKKRCLIYAQASLPTLSIIY